MEESEYWVYKADLASRQARVVARFWDEDNAYDWADEEFDETINIVEETEPLPRPMNAEVFISEVFTVDNSPNITSDN